MKYDAVGEFVDAGRFEYEVCCAFKDCVFDLVGVVGRREHDDRDLRYLVNYCAGGGFAHFWHAHIEDDEIGIELRENLCCLVPVGCSLDHVALFEQY